VETLYHFLQKEKSAMVNTQSKGARRPLNLQNQCVQDDAGTSNDPKTIQIALTNEKITQMTKNMEDLRDKNATLLAHIPEQSHTATVVPKVEREGRNSTPVGNAKKVKVIPV
jgi:hypothetical protein